MIGITPLQYYGFSGRILLCKFAGYIHTPATYRSILIYSVEDHQSSVITTSGCFTIVNDKQLSVTRVFFKNCCYFTCSARSTLKTSMESAKILLTMFLVFVVCWTPFTVVILTDTQNELSFEVSLFTLLLVHSHSCSSCLIYLSFKK